MKHLRLFEDTQNPKIDLFDFFRERDKINKAENKILNLIREYIEINSEHFINNYSFDINDDKLVAIRLEEPFTLVFDDKYQAHGLTEDDFNDLLDFIEDPETYKNAKKFNI